MANTYTDNMQDGVVLTDAKLDTALTSLQLDLPNTALLTTTAAANTFLKASSPGAAATWASPADPVTSGARDYGLNAIASGNNLVISLRTDDGTVPTSSNPVYVTFNTSGTTATRQIRHAITSARSISVTASATLGVSGTSTMYVYVYAAATTTAASGVRLAVASNSRFGDGLNRDATSMSAGADSANTLYATGTISSATFTLLGRVVADRNSSGNWQTPTRVTLNDGVQMSTNQDVNNLLYTVATRSTGTSVGVGGVAMSSQASSVITATSTTPVTVASVVITTSGRPIYVSLNNKYNASGQNSYVEALQTGADQAEIGGAVVFTRGTSTIAFLNFQVESNASATMDQLRVVPSAFSHIDTPAAGTYTYTASIRQPDGLSDSDYTVRAVGTRLVVYEL